MVFLLLHEQNERKTRVFPLRYGPQQHNWPHFKTFVILISIADASQIWYRWKALGEAHRESFPFHERRWHIWITSSSQSASADWLSDSNGRSLWPISAAYGAAATTVSTVSTVNFAFFCNKWGPLSWVECLSGSHATLQRRRKECICKLLVSTRSSNVGQILFSSFLFASLAFSMAELESLIAIIIIRVSCANWLDYYMYYMAKTEEFKEEIKRNTSCEEVKKFWHCHCWQW